MVATSQSGKRHSVSAGSKDASVLWERFERQLGQEGVHEMRVLLLGFAGTDLSSLCFQLRQMGVRSIDQASDVDRLPSCVGKGANVSHIVINLDAFASLEEAVESLFQFRLKDHRETVIVCVSAFVAMDDFGSERSSICDATLRWPVSDRRLQYGLVVGLENLIGAARWNSQEPKAECPDPRSAAIC
jgi:hypothetical protein